MKPWGTLALLILGGVVLIPAALVERAYVLSGLAAALTVAGVVLLRNRPASRWSDVLLIADSAVATFAVMSGVYPLFPILALSLQLGAWNAGHRFGHLETAVAHRDAVARMSARILLASLIPSLAVAGIVMVFLCVRVPMTFALGLGLSLSVMMLLALFVRFAWAARRDRDA